MRREREPEGRKFEPDVKALIASSEIILCASSSMFIIHFVSAYNVFFIMFYD